MKYFTAAAAAMAILVTPSLADFDIYKCYSGGFFGGVSNDWSLFDGSPSCDEAGDAKSWKDSDDVSGDKSGIRCKGDCSLDDNAEDIEVLEMNFGKRDGTKIHWTIYKDDDYKLIGLDGNSYGQCTADGGHETGNCYITGAGHYECNRKFRCESDDDWTAEQLNG